MVDSVIWRYLKVYLLTKKTTGGRPLIFCPWKTHLHACCTGHQTWRRSSASPPKIIPLCGTAWFRVLTHEIWGQTQLVGGWATPLKNMKVNWDDEIPNIWENKTCSKPPTRWGQTQLRDVRTWLYLLFYLHDEIAGSFSCRSTYTISWRRFLM